MARIRRLRYFDKHKLKKMISFLGSDAISHYTKAFMSFPFNALHDILPLKLKFLPESYVLAENKDMIGMITVSPCVGNPFRLHINRLFLERNYFDAGKQLIEFIIAKYGAKGANNFIAAIDSSYTELLTLFTEGCGFRQCSSEQLWKMDTIRFEQPSGTFFRPFKNSDAEDVAVLFNDSVISHFRHSLAKVPQEYAEPIFAGLSSTYKLKYVVDEEKTKKLQAYFSLTTRDNSSYILDITKSAWHDCSYEDVLNFTINELSKRQKDFSLFVKVKKYTQSAENFEKYLIEKNFKCVQNKIILVKDFYKLIKEPEQSHKIVLFNEISEKPVFKI